ncbi:FAD-dependent oxidoreductase [Microlunatus sp. Y2014]|uniref:FAD-dependent oxidoreductase n=1 Tax=Microlunatus sp. Y2014 TaxID=3418488 RepID=UPI003DA78A04
MTSPQTPYADPDAVVDVVVVGGGMSGLVAAVSAARAGSSVALVQDRPVFGGSASSEVRVPVSGAASSNAWSSEGGLIHDLMLRERATNPTKAHPTTVHLDLMLDDLLETTPRLVVFRSTVVHQMIMDGSRITAVVGRQLGSERTIVLNGTHLIDATGDGAVAALAGASFRYGREARHEYGESLAPVEADESSLGSTITMQARRLDVPVPFTAPAWAIDYSNTELTFDRVMPRTDGDLVSGFWWVEVNDPFHQIHDNAAIRRQLHRHVLGLWDYLKNHAPDRDQLTHHHLEWIGQVPGKRESRRVLGDVVITQHDVVRDRAWRDEIGAGGWWIDLHTKGAVANLSAPAERENVDQFYRGMARVAPFSIPLRACYSKDLDNLWLVGRCLSASHVGLGPIRVQQTLAQLGESVGHAAALAVRHGRTPREFAHDDGAVTALQQQLLRLGVRLLNTPNRDVRDHARQAQVVGQGLALQLPEEVSAWVRLSSPRAQVIPELGVAGFRQISCRLRNPGTTSGHVGVTAETLTTIWDREPGESTTLGTIVVPPGADDWFTVSYEPPVSNRPIRIALAATDDPGLAVEWAEAAHPPTGTVVQHLIDAPGGPETKNAHVAVFQPDEIEIPPYRLWQQLRRRTHLLRIEPPARPYEADRVINGWAWPGRGANLWISPPQLPATLELRWDEARTLGEVHLAFDTDLDTSTDARPGLHRAPECVADHRVELLVGGEWVMVASVTGNYRRRQVHTFEPRSTDACRIVVTATNGDPSARIYEVRAYG